MKRNLHARMKPFFRAAVRQDGVLEMLVYEEIGMDYWSGEGITAKMFKQQLDNAGIYSGILVRINSPGGDAFEGVAIGNLLKSTGKTIDVAVDGIAASAASIIAMCGKTITMANNAMMMIHDAWTWGVGNSKEFAKLADTLGKIDGAIAQTYVDRTGKDMSDIRALMDAETWMSAADCLKDGFCTAIAKEDSEADAALAMASRFKALARYQKVPQALAPKDATTSCACECVECLDGECASCSNANCEDPNCKDCPAQMEADNSSNVSLYRAKQFLVEHHA